VTFTVTPPGGTGTVVLTFEGLQNGEGVASYYNSGSGSLGSGPGPGYGITFNSDASAIINSDNGGTGNFQGQPSGKTVLYFLTGSAATMNVAAGFTSGFSFYYSAPFSPGTINVWSGANSTGVLLATLTLPVTPAASSSPGICTTASENYCPWVPLGVSFSGIAHSVDFGGTINHIGFDNITLGSVNAAPPTNSALSISSISPQTAPAGGPSFTLTVNGTGFTSRSVVQWNGNPLATTFISSTQLTAIVPASLISSLLVASVTVTDNGQTTFTISFQTTPPVTLPVTPTGGLAHFAVGQNWTTGIFIVNTGNSTANYGISFYDDNGNPVSLPFSTGAASRLTGSLAPFASTYIEAANANAALVSGWGQISADATIAIQSLFRSTLNNVRYEAAVNSSAGTRAFLMPFDATNFAPGVPLYTGLAIANLDASNPATITCTPRVSGGTVIPGGVAIPTIRPLGHWAGFQFPSLSGQRGTLDCTSSTNVSVVALRFIGTDTFSSLPVINR
jgi:hypothetical protein